MPGWGWVSVMNKDSIKFKPILTLALSLKERGLIHFMSKL
jgi:hypothetical protein